MDISFFKDFIRLFVGTGRFELPTLAGCASETHAYTNSATCPYCICIEEGSVSIFVPRRGLGQALARRHHVFRSLPTGAVHLLALLFRLLTKQLKRSCGSSTYSLPYLLVRPIEHDGYPHSLSSPLLRLQNLVTKSYHFSFPILCRGEDSNLHRLPLPNACFAYAQQRHLRIRAPDENQSSLIFIPASVRHAQSAGERTRTSTGYPDCS
ncbi:MAG: hypothetical protein UW78_C0005G0015 [Candidatus Azambacteria bacterium GW2011_GWA1_44_9]|uniref:Uncharacterized protein n=1 Tax=Candidatus Azambacteria bacterium GW2011_GWA1_44_9 TaxID=1618610 RepID=A0A0G1KDI9_9BACT|nr:MAG: hypothetical protein UW78_C0005G0015 [Candidatus Azambacteria bacterium GW2011_GWA1_44_9]